MTQAQQYETATAMAQPLPRWSERVLWIDCIVLVLAGIVAGLSTINLFRNPGQLIIIAGVLIWSKVGIGLYTNAQLLSAKRRGLHFAYLAAAAAVLSMLFQFNFVTQPTPSLSQFPWLVRNESWIKIFLFFWVVGWNILYGFAARAASSTNPRVNRIAQFS